MTESVFEFIGKLSFIAGGSVAIAYGFFRFLGKKWLEHIFAEKLEASKSAHNKELEDVKYRINALFNRVTKIHEKEYEVLPNAWIKLHDAKDYIAHVVNPIQQYPDFNRLSEQDIKRILKKNDWEDYDIEQLISATDKNTNYMEKSFWKEYNQARTNFSEFHKYIMRNRIFLSSDLKEQFNKADELMWDALITREVGEDAKDYKMKYESYKMLNDNIEKIISEIESLLQDRLRYNDAL